LAFDDVVGEFENYTRPATGAIKAIIAVSSMGVSKSVAEVVRL
jgi:hypothetical protein